MEKVRLPTIETFKIIKDPIHGYIPLTKLEYEILQTRVFNRLHDLKQTSMAYLVYPGAVTTRFQHSIGVMHLASNLSYQLLQSVDESTFIELFPRFKKEADRRGLIQTVRLAALLHDLGHGPFSHALEDVMRATLKQDYKPEFSKAMELFEVSDETHLAAHEYYSYMLIKGSAISDLAGKAEGPTISVDDISSLIAKKIDSKAEFATGIGLGLLRKIVSSQLDADRMDYLTRDAYMTGVPYGVTDVARVIMNMSIREDNRGKYEVAIHERALGAVEDMLDARFKMYKWLYSHHMVVASNELLKQATISLIEEGKLDSKDFYWTNFSEGRIADTFLMNKIFENASNMLCKGLLDRRFLPVSLLKRPSDHRAFLIEIMEATGRDTPLEAVEERLKKFLPELQAAPEIETTQGKARTFAVFTPRSPYKAVGKGDAIWVYTDQNPKLMELTKSSDYFAAINREWANFPSIYISYLVPGKTKDEARTLRIELKRNLIERIVNF